MATTLAYDIVARDRASSTFGKIAKAAGFLGVAIGAAGIAQFIRESVSVEAQFSQTMASLQVNAGVGKDALGDLHDLAIQLGKDTVFSANEAAQAMLELSKGGMSAAQIQGGALASTLNLAATEGIDLDQAAVIMSQTLHTFGLNAQQSAAAVDMLAAGAVASTASVEDLSAGLKYVGSTAKSMRIPMDDVVTGLAQLNSAGLDSTTAGSSLNRMLLGLSLTTPKAATAAEDLGLKFDDAKGNLLPMEDIVKRLGRAFDGLSTTERTQGLKAIFGVEGMRAANILLDQGVKKWEKMGDAVNETGVAQKLADARMSGTAGTLERLDGAIETAQLALGERLAPTIQEVGDYLSENMVDGMNDALDATEDLWDASQPLVTVLKDLAEVTVDLGGFLGDLPGPMKQLGVETLVALLLFPKLATGVSLASTKLSALTTSLTAADTRMEMLSKTARTAAGVGGMVLLSEAAQETDLKMKTLYATAGAAATGFAVAGPFGAVVGGAAGAMLTLSTHTDDAKKSFAESIGTVETYAATLDSVTGAATRATKAQILSDLAKGDAIASANELGITTRDLVGSIIGEKAAHDRVAKAIAAADEGTVSYIDTQTGALTTYGTHAKALGDVKEALGFLPGKYSAARKAALQEARATQDLSDLYGKLPKKVVTALEQTGVDPTVRGIAKVAAKYDLVPKEIRSLIEAIGVDATVRDIQRVKDRFDALPNYKRITIETHLMTTQDQGGGMGQRTSGGRKDGRTVLDPQRGRMVGGGADVMAMAQAVAMAINGARLQVIPGTQNEFFLLTGAGL